MNACSRYLAVLGLSSACLSLSASAQVRAPFPDFSGPLFTEKLRKVQRTRNVLAILWDPHRTGITAPAAEEIDERIFGLDSSAAGWFRENSGGKVALNRVGTLGWYDADKPWEHYANENETADSDGDGWLVGHSEKWTEAIRKADADFDFSRYDSNGDRVLRPEELTVVIVIPQDSGYGTVRDVVGKQAPRREPLLVDGVQMTTIAEWYSGTPPQIGVLCHELAHIIADAADLHSVPDSWPYVPRRLSIMDDDDGATHLDPFHKLKLGWLKPTVVNADGEYALRDVESTGEALIVFDQTRCAGEYLLIENRWRGSSYDSSAITGGGGLPADGLAVWHIVEDPAILLHIPTPGTHPWEWGRRGIRLIRRNGGSPIDDGEALFSKRGDSVSDSSAPARLNWITPPRDTGISLTLRSDAAPEMKVEILGSAPDLPTRFRQANDFAGLNGHGAGFPNYHRANPGWPPGLVFGTALLKPEAVQVMDVPASDLGHPATPEERFRAVNDYAGRNGYAAAFPNFHAADRGGGIVMGVALIKPGFAVVTDVPASELGNPRTLEERFRAANDYAGAHGYSAGFPNFHETDSGDGRGLVYGIALVAPGAAAVRDIAGCDLTFGTVNVQGGPLADTFTLRRSAESPDVVEVLKDGTLYHHFDSGRAQSIKVYGDSGADTLIVDLSRGNPIPADLGLTYDGGNPGTRPGDKLIVRGAGNSSGVYLPDGTFTVDNRLIRAFNIEPVVVEGMKSLAFQAQGMSSRITLDNPSDHQTRVSGTVDGRGFEELVFSGVEGLVLSTGQGLDDVAGNNEITLAAPPAAAGLKTISVAGGAGTDSLLIDAGSVTSALVSPSRILFANGLTIHLTDMESPRAIHRVIHPAQVLDDGSKGFEQSGSWSRVKSSDGYGGDYLVHRAGREGDSARWRLRLPAGRYELFSRWVEGPDRASDVLYEIFVNGAKVRAVRFDQRQRPEDGELDSLAWTSLGELSIDESPCCSTTFGSALRCLLRSLMPWRRKHTIEVRVAASSAGAVLADAMAVARWPEGR